MWSLIQSRVNQWIHQLLSEMLPGRRIVKESQISLYLLLTKFKEVKVFCQGEICQILLSFSFLFCFFRDTPVAHGSFQTRSNQSYSCWPMPQPPQCHIWAASVIYTTAHSNAGSLTHWVRPGIKPSSSWIPVWFLTYWATTGTPDPTLTWWSDGITNEKRPADATCYLKQECSNAGRVVWPKGETTGICWSV